MRSFENPCPPGIAPDSSGVTTLFLFDYECLERSGDDSVFRAIRTCLDRSAGVCALTDTGLLSVKTLAKFANNAAATKAVDGGVVGNRQYRSITPSGAALWTDRPENVELFHDYLNLHVVPRYHGAVLLDESGSYEDFLRFCARWSPASAAVRRSVLHEFAEAGLGMLEGVAGWWLRIFAQARQSLLERRMLYLEASIGVLLLTVLLFFVIGRGRGVVPVNEQTAKQEIDAGVKFPIVDDSPQRLSAGKNDRLVQDRSGTMLEELEEAVREEESISVPPVASVAPIASMPPKLASVAPIASVPPKVADPVPARPHVGSGRNRTPASHEGRFTVQVGSFRKATHATVLAKRLRAQGYRALESTVKLTNGRTMHRVRVGAFETRREARAFGEQLKRRETFIAEFFVAAKE